MSNTIPPAPRSALGKLIEYAPVVLDAGLAIYRVLREPPKDGVPLPRLRTGRELLRAAYERAHRTG